MSDFCEETERSAKGPRLTVLMALNRMDAYLQPAIESILNQTYEDFEFLIIIDSLCPGLTERVLELGRVTPGSRSFMQTLAEGQLSRETLESRTQREHTLPSWTGMT